MTTAADIIKGSLRLLQVIGSETAIEADEIQDGIEDLNDWASALESGYISLGFTPVVNSGDTVNIPRQAVGMYKTNLALYIAGQYGMPVSQTLFKSAQDSMSMVLNTFQQVIVPNLPDTLPMGDGNECGEVNENQKFFPSNNAANF